MDIENNQFKIFVSDIKNSNHWLEKLVGVKM